MYYNTNNEKGKTLNQSIAKTETQEEIIYKMFLKHKRLSASSVWRMFDEKTNTPLTSVRRAITNLCYDKKLVKTEDKSIGVYGKKEHIYKLVIK